MWCQMESHQSELSTMCRAYQSSHWYGSGENTVRQLGFGASVLAILAVRGFWKLEIRVNNSGCVAHIFSCEKIPQLCNAGNLSNLSDRIAGNKFLSK